MNSVYKYIQSLDTDIIPVESGGSEEVSIEHNTAAIKKKNARKLKIVKQVLF